jgi:hypothetical protein
MAITACRRNSCGNGASGIDEKRLVEKHSGKLTPVVGAQLRSPHEGLGRTELPGLDDDPGKVLSEQRRVLE